MRSQSTVRSEIHCAKVRQYRHDALLTKSDGRRNTQRSLGLAGDIDSGIDRLLHKAMECLGELPVLSSAAKGEGSLMAANAYAPLFPIELVEKDFRYGLQTAQPIDAKTSTLAACHRVYQEAIAQGYGCDNMTGVIQLFR